MTIRSDSRLFFYQCRNCAGTAVASTKAAYGEPYTCVLCFSWLKFLYVMPVTTDEHRGWWKRGVVFNPGIGKDPLPGSLREIPE